MDCIAEINFESCSHRMYLKNDFERIMDTGGNNFEVKLAFRSDSKTSVIKNAKKKGSR